MLGNILTKADTQLEPSVEITPLNSTDGGTYTIAMLDPDAPSKQDPKFGPFRHWVVCSPISSYILTLTSLCLNSG